MENNFDYFENKECKYFPCHKVESGVFNCLFCYCPLYDLVDECGGNYVYIDGETKDCSNCLIPHSENGYSYIISKLSEKANKNQDK